MTRAMKTRVKVLEGFLNDGVEIKASEYGTFQVAEREYMVLTDQEAGKRVFEYVRESIWAFHPEFIAEHVRFVDDVTSKD